MSWGRGQERKKVNKRKHLASSIAPSAKVADKHALIQFQNAPGRCRKGQIYPCCIVQEKHQGIKWQDFQKQKAR